MDAVKGVEFLQLLDKNKDGAIDKGEAKGFIDGGVSSAPIGNGSVDDREAIA